MKKQLLSDHDGLLWSVRFNPAHEHLLATAGKDGTGAVLGCE